MAAIMKKACKRGFPCAVCGKEDHCYTADYGNGQVWYCSTYKDIPVTNNGYTYLFKGLTPSLYARYVEEETANIQKQKWIKEQEINNPNWVKTKRNNKKAEKISVEEVVTKQIILDEVSPLSNERLNEIYSYMLSLLKLEDAHKRALLCEWNSGIDKTLGDRILKTWPIKSLPIPDRLREKGYESDNIKRSELLKKLTERFRSLRGVPGFYKETVKKADKNGKMRTYTTWKMVALSGIVFPEYDSKGNIYRLRIGDSHVTIREYAKNAKGEYLYKTVNGIKKHEYSSVIRFNYQSGEWEKSALSKDGKEDKWEVIYSPLKNIRKVTLSDKGYPITDGKSEGKYKNFSSRSEASKEELTTDENGKKVKKIYTFNRYEDGTQSGSNLSLYKKEGDDYKFLYVTEGEKKAMVINMLLNCPAISLPGVQTFNLLFKKEYLKDKSVIDFLLSKGLKGIIICYDADKATNPLVSSSEESLIISCLKENIRTFVGEWDLSEGKGVDDILIKGIKIKYSERSLSV